MAILTYTEKITREPWTLKESDLEALRQEQISDEGILQVITIASMFALFNRVADATGLGKPHADLPELHGAAAESEAEREDGK